jgi:hypothetical protein
MSRRLPAMVEAGTRLQRIESLLDQAVADLVGKEVSARCSNCAAALAEAAAELQFFAGLLTGTERKGLEARDVAALARRIKALLPRLHRAQRLLLAAAEFYRGWCAAVPAVSYPWPAYQADGWSRGPALLALEC